MLVKIYTILESIFNDKKNFYSNIKTINIKI